MSGSFREETRFCPVLLTLYYRNLPSVVWPSEVENQRQSRILQKSQPSTQPGYLFYMVYKSGGDLIGYKGGRIQQPKFCPYWIINSLFVYRDLSQFVGEFSFVQPRFIRVETTPSSEPSRTIYGPGEDTKTKKKGPFPVLYRIKFVTNELKIVIVDCTIWIKIDERSRIGPYSFNHRTSLHLCLGV